jgi:hypothetical protein
MSPLIPRLPFAGLLLVAALTLDAQAPPGVPPASPATAKSRAPINLTGYWVSIVTEDWRYRMLTAPKGDYYSLPLNPAARKVADAWDPAKAAAENACLNYGAPTIMRVPGRLHITWDNEDSLRIDTDAGKQTRRFPFNASRAPAADATLQGSSAAEWQTPARTRSSLAKLSAQDPNTPGFIGIFHGAGPPPAPPPSTTGTLKVVTSHILRGRLRNNGVPYSANVAMTEYYDLHKEPGGDQWIVVTTIVDDPQYLDAPYVTTTHFKREPDGSKWDPRPCELILPSK